MNNRGLMLVLSTAVISGFSIFINKYSVSVINPYIFTFLKNIIVALLLTSVLFAFGKWRMLKKLTTKQWLLLITIGLIGGSAPFLLFFKGLSMTSAAQGSFIHKTMFIYVTILAIVFLKEKINKDFLIGALLLLVGNSLLLKKLSFNFGKGDILVLLAVFFWAIENVISKYALRELNGSVVAWGRMFFGSLFILLFLIFIGQTSLIVKLTPQQISWTLITSILLFGYIMSWYHGLKYLPVSLATSILLLGSPITTFLSLVSGTKISGQEFFASLVIIAGIILIFDLVKKAPLTGGKEYVRA